jgi:hypothetical protein
VTAIGVTSATTIAAQETCTPALGIKNTQFSAMKPPTMERQWTAVLSVDASRCASNSGPFELAFSRLKENAPETDFRERFMWQAPEMTVSVDFWADEAVDGYRLVNVAPCPCRK